MKIFGLIVFLFFIIFSGCEVDHAETPLKNCESWEIYRYDTFNWTDSRCYKQGKWFDFKKSRKEKNIKFDTLYYRNDTAISELEFYKLPW